MVAITYYFVVAVDCQFLHCRSDLLLLISAFETSCGTPSDSLNAHDYNRLCLH